MGLVLPLPLYFLKGHFALERVTEALLLLRSVLLCRSRWRDCLLRVVDQRLPLEVAASRAVALPGKQLEDGALGVGGHILVDFETPVR